MNEKYLKILSILQRAVKKDDYSEIESISTGDLISAKINLVKSEGTPAYSLLLEIIKNRKNNAITQDDNLCGVLAKKSCDMKQEISEKYSSINVFLDIPYINYEDCEDILNSLLTLVGLNPIVAKGKVTSQAMLCKICKAIRACKYGITDISSGSNSVSYEYGLMHGFGMNVALLMRENTDKFSDITGLEHLEYNDLHSFKLIIAKWLLENVPEADKERLKKVIKDESENLKKNNSTPYKQIRSISSDLTESNKVEIPSTDKSSIYFKSGEALVKRKFEGKSLEITYHSDSLLYLRLIPKEVITPLKQRELKAIVYGINLNPLRQNLRDGASWEQNQYGGITFSKNKGLDDKYYFTSSQVFPNREIWGLDSTLLARGYIHMKALEEMFELALKHYLDVATKLMNLKPPFIIEAGATDVKDFKIFVGEKYEESNWGPIYHNEIKSRHTLQNLQNKDIDSILLAIYEDFFDAVGEGRPENFRGFPSNDINN